jgi:CHAD domain-containing protein
MPTPWKIRPKKSFRENAVYALSAMYDHMMSYSSRVIDHPNLKAELHTMRIAGKPLRYTMEIYESSFGDVFRERLTEVKHLLELMGEIHDCDVNIPILEDHLKETVLFNKTVADHRERISTKSLRRLLSTLRTERRQKFYEVSGILKRWKQINYGKRIIDSLMV